MKFRAKCFSLLLAVLFAVSAISCAKMPETSGGKVKIVCTVFPVYDWVRAIVGEENENVSVSLLLNNGTDLHSYQPSAADIVTIASADLFVHIGGGSDEWVSDVLKTSGREEQNVLNLSELLADRMLHEEAPEGAEEEHVHDETCDHEGEVYDEHIWLSLRNAALVSQSVCDALCEMDPERAERYRTNAEEYRAKLNALDAEYTEAVEDAQRKELLFGDRFPFRYLAEDYGLQCYAAFPGCSSETDASFETVIRLADVMDDRKLPVLMVTESSDQAVAKSILENTTAKDREILVLDSMQSVTAAQIAEGISYLTIMEKNLDVLCVALGAE